MKAIFLFCSFLVAGWASFDASPALAVDEAGNAVAVWEANISGSFTIRAATFDPMSLDWSDPVSVSDPDSLFPDIALTPDGEVIVGVWQSYAGITAQIEAALSGVGEMFGMATAIPGQMTRASRPKVALDSNGNGVAVWQGTTSSGFAVYSSSFLNGSWSTPALVNNMGSSLFPSPNLSIDPMTGDAIVVWQQLFGNFSRVQAAFFPFGETWGNAVVLSDDALNASNGRIAFSSSGKAIAVWHQDNEDGKTTSVRSKVWSAGAWSPTLVVRSDSCCMYSLPEISINSSGTGLAILISKKSDGQSIETLLYDPVMGEWKELTSFTTQNQVGTPQIALNNSEQAAAVWTSTVDGKVVIQAATRAAPGIADTYSAPGPAGMWSSIQTISDGMGDSLSPVVGIDSAGNAIALWQDVASSSIQAARFSGSWSAPTTVGSISP